MIKLVWMLQDISTYVGQAHLSENSDASIIWTGTGYNRFEHGALQQQQVEEFIPFGKQLKRHAYTS
jgi:hypothetical protein